MTTQKTTRTTWCFICCTTMLSTLPLDSECKQPLAHLRCGRSRLHMQNRTVTRFSSQNGCARNQAAGSEASAFALCCSIIDDPTIHLAAARVFVFGPTHDRCYQPPAMENVANFHLKYAKNREQVRSLLTHFTHQMTLSWSE